MVTNTFKQTLRHLYEEVHEQAWDEQSPEFATNVFTNVILEDLAERGKWPDPEIVYYKNTKQGEIAAYGIDDDAGVLYLCVSDWADSLNFENLTQRTVTSKFKNLKKFFQNAIENNLKLEGGADAEGASITIRNRYKDGFSSIQFYFLTNKRIPEKVKLPNFDELSMPHEIELLGLEDITQLRSPGYSLDSINIDFLAQFGEGISCLPASASQKGIRIFSAFLPGNILGGIYSTFGPRLLELNVRSFLQATGKVNKGIKQTIKQEPERFLSYNNGITATSSSVGLNEDESEIRFVNDFQVVNGGQTTASLSRALNEGLNLDQIFVHMKLVEVSEKLVDELVPQISRYANRQNAVQEADLTAHHPFHAKMKELSENMPVISTGAKSSYWFYERIKGAHSNMINESQSNSERKRLKQRFPTKQKLTKTDLAKYYNSWDRRPWEVSSGAVKNYAKFMTQLAIGDVIEGEPTEEFFKESVAKAIIFRETDSIVKKQKFGGLKSQIVCFTVSYISEQLNGALDYNKIWEAQALSETWEEAITVTCGRVQKKLLNSAGEGVDVAQYAKKEDAWTAIQEIRIDFNFHDLLTLKYVLAKGKDYDETLTRDERDAVRWVQTVTPETVQHLAEWYVENKFGRLPDWNMVNSMATEFRLGNQITPPQAKYLRDLYVKALNNGM